MTEMSQAQIHKLTAADIDQILAIENKAYAHPWTAAIINDCFKHKNYCLGLRTPEAQLLAYVFYSVAVGECQILNITTDPNQQNKGLGRVLMTDVMNFARAKRCTQILLEVRKSNASARHLYQSLGFQKIGTRKNYYPAANNSQEDALVLSYEIL